jgi:transcriptional regulator with XRE-family HTH domain
VTQTSYWWTRYGNFDPGEGIYPHMGQVISHYRLKRGFRTQQDLATALGVSKRTIEELEGAMNLNGPDSIERRQVLAKLLRIPPALLALDWRFLAYDDPCKVGVSPFAEPAELLHDDLFRLYQQVLLLGRGYLYNGGSDQIADMLGENLAKLIPMVQQLPAFEKEPWQELICKYYQLASSFALRRMQKKQALSCARQAILCAQELEHAALIASGYYRRARLYLDFARTASSEEERKRCLESAKADAQAAFQYREQVSPVLRGNIYLIGAELLALTEADLASLKRCQTHYDKVSALLHRDPQEEDDTFILLNATGLHHELAKFYLYARRPKEAHRELQLARKTLRADVLTWHVNLNLTEAAIYKAEGDVEQSAACALEALRVLKAVRSPKEELLVKQLFLELQAIDDCNPTVCHLGLLIDRYERNMPERL